jgi:hypothetical protein
MSDQEPSWGRIQRSLAAERRRLHRTMSRTTRQLARGPIPARESRRRRRKGLALVGVGWAAAVGGEALLLRGHGVTSNLVFLAFLIGSVGAKLAALVWFGSPGRAYLPGGPAGSLMSARTLTGARTLDLDELASVRLLELEALDRKFRDSTYWWLRDRHGVRIAVNAGEELDATLRRAVERAGDRRIRVTLSASDRLAGRRPRSEAHKLGGFTAAYGVPTAGTAVTLALACLVAAIGR